MRLVSFNYKDGTVTITETIGNVIFLKIISWEEMTIKALRGLHEIKT